MANDCPNLKELFGKDYRITFDQCYDAKGRHSLDPWMMTIPCRHGITIYPYGVNTLAVEIDRHTFLAKRVAAIEGVRLWIDGDHEKTFLFPPAVFEQVAALVRPKRKRKVSEDAKARGREALERYRSNQKRQESSAKSTISEERHE